MCTDSELDGHIHTDELTIVAVSDDMLIVAAIHIAHPLVHASAVDFEELARLGFGGAHSHRITHVTVVARVQLGVVLEFDFEFIHEAHVFSLQVAKHFQFADNVVRLICNVLGFHPRILFYKN